MRTCNPITLQKGDPSIGVVLRTQHVTETFVRFHIGAADMNWIVYLGGLLL